MRLTPINAAEAIIEPFWDAALSGLASWQIGSGEAYGLRVSQNWRNVLFEWRHKPSHGPALHMSAKYDIVCGAYDKLLVSMTPPRQALITVLVETDQGPRRNIPEPSKGKKQEIEVALDGARKIVAVTIEIEAGEEGNAIGWIDWIGLQNSDLLPRHLEQWRHFDGRWEYHLKPEDYQPEFKPAYGIIFDGDDLEEMRSECRQWQDQQGVSVVAPGAQEMPQTAPEEMIGEFFIPSPETSVARLRDFHKGLSQHGMNAAVAGLLFKDKELLRLGARYCLATVMCEHWDDSFMTRFPGSAWDHACFQAAVCAFEVALLLDLTGELFTDLGRQLALDKLARSGVGNINACAWKHEYIWHCNQLAWFTAGRMAAQIVLEKNRPRIKPYTEQVKNEIIETLENTILPDGGYVEGTGYFQTVSASCGKALYMYARARGQEISELIPPSIKRTANFAEVLSSTDASQDFIPICDGGGLHDLAGLAFMAAAVPDSCWSGLFWKAYARAGFVGHKRPPSSLNAVLVHLLKKKCPESTGSVSYNISNLADMGPACITWQIQKHQAKLFVMGNRAGASHTHEDKGSFVLEFAGQTYAMDPGTCSYADPLSHVLKHCQRHNMLVPVVGGSRPRPDNPLNAEIKPVFVQKENVFLVELDLSSGWHDYYEFWRRKWEVRAPDLLVITDSWKIKTGDGVMFYWNTALDVESTGGGILIKGEAAHILLIPPPECQVEIDELPYVKNKFEQRVVSLKRIALLNRRKQGAMAVAAKFIVLKGER